MAVVSVSQVSCFEPGADLWIVPERKNSTAVQKLDWYLNFQISKSSKHQTRPLPEKITELLKKCALQSYDFVETSKQEAKECLLLLSSQQLPSRWVMVLRGSDHFEDWVKDLSERWKKMNSPSLRVFLPTGRKASEFEKIWKKSGGDEDLTVVID